MSQLNIYQKLAKVREHVEVLRKDKAAYNYTYVDAETILANITGTMKELGISLIPNIVPGTTEVNPRSFKTTKFDKAGNSYEVNNNEVIIHADMEFHWVNDENPDERVIVPWALIGQKEDASQAFGSGLTYCGRYFLLEYFNIATTKDDPDLWRGQQQEAMEKEQREIAKKITEEIVSFIQTQLAEKPRLRDAAQDLIKKYSKDKGGKPSHNPNHITDPAVAAKLFTEVKNLFGFSDEQAAA